MRRLRSLAPFLTLLAAPALALADGAVFKITLDPAVASSPVSGRLFLGVISPGHSLAADQTPLDSPFWDDPQPMFGLDVARLAPGQSVRIDDHTGDYFPLKPGALKPGDYSCAARLVINRRSSSWRNDPGNLYSSTVRFTIPAPTPDAAETPGAPVEVSISLDEVTRERQWPKGAVDAGIRPFEVRSKLLSDFSKREVMLRAGIVYPVGFDPKSTRKYPAIYYNTGFGDDHFDALRLGAERLARLRAQDSSPESRLDREAFIIVPDPESPNGHTLFVDSPNNGPRERALVEELIPALERELPLIPQPNARILRGHSSGGWSSLWLALRRPQVFGAAWSSSPDPVDFRALELLNIYSDPNAYISREPHERDAFIQNSALPLSARERAMSEGTEWPAYRKDGRTLMTVRQENAGETLQGPHLTSGQQWASWQAAWGPRSADGSITPLFDPATGEFNKGVLEDYLKCDIGYLLRTDPGRIAPLLLARVRLIVGAEDSFYLEQAVTMLKQDLARIAMSDSRVLNRAGARELGSITIVPDTDHGTVLQSDAAKAIPAQMLEHLSESGIIDAR